MSIKFTKNMDNKNKVIKPISIEKRREYNQTYYDKNRMKILKKCSDRKDLLKGKIKLSEKNDKTKSISY
tara:strand:- start:3865 stop:4071 length:207 start_codon:yes stop_codon:yes gene_type:complete